MAASKKEYEVCDPSEIVTHGIQDLILESDSLLMVNEIKALGYSMSL